MARHANPREIQELKGAHKVNPGRYKGEVPKSEYPLCVPPEHLSESAKAIWFEFAEVAPRGVLTGADSAVLELASNLMTEYREDPKAFAVGKYSHLIGCLARLGMSPADRTKLAIEKPKDGGGFDNLDD